MPSISLPVFAFGSAYIGNYGASAVLTQLTDLRTQGAALTESMPTQFEQVLGKDVQSGNHIFTVQLDFYSDSLMTANLTRGQSISNTSYYSAPATNTYALLLVPPDSTVSSAYYFPKLRTLKVRDVAYRKNAPVGTQITFIAEDRDPNVTLFYQDTVANLISIMGSCSPY